MLTNRQHVPDEPHPWEHAHAAPEDRALGLELELIELVHQQADHGEHPSADGSGWLGDEIEEVVAELVAVAEPRAAVSDHATAHVAGPAAGEVEPATPA